MRDAAGGRDGSAGGVQFPGRCPGLACFCTFGAPLPLSAKAQNTLCSNLTRVARMPEPDQGADVAPAKTDEPAFRLERREGLLIHLRHEAGAASAAEDIHGQREEAH